MQNRITNLFGIKYPIIQAGMIWCSGWELASAVSNAGGLGIIGAGSMYPDILRVQIQKCKQATDKPFAVNLPLLYPDIDKHIATILEEKVPIVFTSAGNPAVWTETLKNAGIKVVHVVQREICTQGRRMWCRRYSGRRFRSWRTQWTRRNYYTRTHSTDSENSKDTRNSRRRNRYRQDYASSNGTGCRSGADRKQIRSD